MISPVLTTLVAVDFIPAVAVILVFFSATFNPVLVILVFFSATSVILAFLSATFNPVSIISILVTYLVITIRSRGFRYGKNLWN